MSNLELIDSLDIDDTDEVSAIEAEAPPLVGVRFWDAAYANVENTAIDMMLAHPTHGEIAITINEEEYPEVWADVVAAHPSPYVPPSEAAQREAWRGGAYLTRAAFCTALRAAGILNRSEAIAAAKGDWPASFEPMLDDMTEAEADAALILWAGISVIERAHPLLEDVRQFKGLSQEDVDALFGYKP